MLDHFVPSYFAYHARHNLMDCRMGPQSASEYIDEFRNSLINCADVLESKVKFIFEMNLAD